MDHRWWLPAAAIVVLAAPAAAETRYPVYFQAQQRADGLVDLWALNTLPTTATVDLELYDLSNMATVGWLRTAEVPAGGRLVMARLKVLEPRGRWDYRYRYYYQPASRSAHPEDVVYDLPFPRGTYYKVGQGYYGRFSHQHVRALDILMPEGSTVLAAREGLVVETESRHTEGGPSEAFRDSANFVKILHDDGTLAEYEHLAPGGVLVDVGERVARGQAIGLSGNTGYSTAPHLHFEVRVPTSGRAYETLATRFHTFSSGAAGEVLKQGQRYAAP